MPEEAKGSYGAMVKALKKRFRPVDVELRGMEFHQITQETESVEEMGIKLQVLAREAFHHSMSLYRKGGSNKWELDITELTLVADGRKVTIPVYVQPDSE